MSAGSRSSGTSAPGMSVRSGEPRTIRTYPSSPKITRPANYGDGGAGRARSFSGNSGGRSSSGRSYGRTPSRSSGSSSGRVSSRGSSSSGRSSSSRGSSSGSRGSSGGRSSGGGVRKR
jgi:hypothetical protein